MLSLFAIHASIDVANKFFIQKITPIWNYEKAIKQECKNINTITIKLHVSFKDDDFFEIINFTKDIAFNLDRQQYNISELLSKDEKELNRRPEGEVVTENNHENTQNVSAFPSLELHKKKDCKTYGTVQLEIDSQTFYKKLDFKKINYQRNSKSSEIKASFLMLWTSK